MTTTGAGEREKGTLRFSRFVVRRRGPIGALLIAATLFFLYPIANAVFSGLGHALPGPSVRLDSRARDLFPDHPYIHALDKFSGRFGNSATVAIAVVVNQGTIYTPETLAKIDRVTRWVDGEGLEELSAERAALQSALGEEGRLTPEQVRQEVDRRLPPYPINHYEVRSLTHETTRVIEIQKEGGLLADFLIEDLPKTQEQADAIAIKVRDRAPHLRGRFVSEDGSTALVLGGFVADRLNSRGVYERVFDHLDRMKKREEDANHRILITGVPILTGWVLVHAWEIGASVLAAVVTLFVLLWLYFRRGHGVLIPLVAAGVTAIWGTGFTGWVGIVFDPLILVIPMLITARAVSHTVQMAERFFEDYEALYERLGDREAAKLEAAQTALAELIVPGTLGILTDVAGLLVILVTTIPQMRNLGIFGAFWVAAIVATVELLHPILICWLPAPHEHRHYVPQIMVRFTAAIGHWTTHRFGKWAIAGGTLALFFASGWIAVFHSQIGDATPGTPLFWPDHPFNRATGEIAARFGGADTLVVYADGDRDNSALDLEPIEGMERLERTLLAETDARGALSLVPLLRIAARQFFFGDPKAEALPDSTGAIRGTVFQLTTTSPPGALASLLTPDGRAATTTLFYPDHKGETIHRALQVAERFIDEHPLGQVSVRLRKNHAAPDAPFWHPEAAKDFLYYMIGPLLWPRAHTLAVLLRDESGSYRPLEVRDAARDGLPTWLDSFRDAAVAQYQAGLEALPEGHVYVWPARLADWSPDDVGQWWEDEELGVRAVAVNTQDLLVHDLLAKKSAPTYQPTSSWTRGVQFVLAGGPMGILAAVNDEVERGHLANISLIFVVIFLLHSITYRSVPSGAIITLQLATATLLSLAYMAGRGVGLNINTLPVQAVGVGLGVDYAIYIVDRIRQETAATGGDVDEAIRRAIRTTGLAVSFTATTVIGGIGFWMFSNLRFQAEMAQLLAMLMLVNMLGAITIVPALYSIVRPRVAMSLMEPPTSAASGAAAGVQSAEPTTRGAMR
jgi:predicted RND superfamily exporter protein